MRTKPIRGDRVWSLGDREAGIYELFERFSNEGNPPHLLVRSQHDRHLAEEQGKLGGFLGRKSDGFAGCKSLWRGLEKLDTIVEAWRIRTVRAGALGVAGETVECCR